ncbi:MAG: hypothetical protein O2960_14575 [Verrucomicrobia bacterium]|nr:hypothetical protein [Verrucomicrobiota bacterium]
MKMIRHSTTLYYYDGPQVFEARDAIGGHYIAVMVEPDGGKEQFLVAGVEPERLRQFRMGTLDLRSLLVERGEPEWFLALPDGDLDAPLSLQPQASPLASFAHLPEPGFLLHDRPTMAEALREARARNNLVMEVAVEPPEAAAEHRIRMVTLAGLLTHLQTMVKHAYGVALRELSLDTRRSIDRSDAHLLDVVIPAAPGSFRVVLEASKLPDMLGQSEMARALQRIDALFDNVGDPQKTLAMVKTHRGHLAGAYLRMLCFLVQSRSGLRYSWAEPNFQEPRARAVTEAEAGPLVDLLSGVSNLGAENVTLVGALERADVVSGAWRLATQEGDYSGKTKEGGPSLAGLKLGNTYRFTCLEEIEETQGGREQRTLYLTDHEPV